MSEGTGKLKDEIVERVANDYFTPNIKAEVILDTLLTPYIAQILKNECGIEAVLLTKEMSMTNFNEKGEEISQEDNRGSKVDYVLVDKEENGYVYLVELKTTKHIDSKQKKHYISCCYNKGEPRTFREVFGNKLMEILANQYYKGKKDSPWRSDKWSIDVMEKDFQDTIRDKGGKNYSNYKCERGEYKKDAIEFLKRKRYDSTYKYLYTVGQILDCTKDVPLDRLWEKKLRLLYIMPEGKLSELYPVSMIESGRNKYDDVEEEAKKSNCKQDYDKIRKEIIDKMSIDLYKAVESLETGRDGKDDTEYLEMLKCIIKKIYREE